MSALSLDAVSRFVRILARCGVTPEDITQAVGAAAGRIPRSWTSRAQSAPREIDDAAHVLTLWFSEAGFVDAAGRPLSLPLEGGSRSVAALVRRVDRRLRPKEVLGYLLSTGAVRREGRRFVPRARSVLLRGARGPDYFRTLRVLSNMLGTLEHNVKPKRSARGWFEYMAENPRFPVRAREELDERVHRLGQEMLARLDAYMRRREVTARRGEPTLRVGVGMHLFEGHPAKPRSTSPRRRGSSRRPSRARSG